MPNRFAAAAEMPASNAGIVCLRKRDEGGKVRENDSIAPDKIIRFVIQIIL
jgi:hypothetical protein